MCEMIVISDTLYSTFREVSFYNFLEAFLNEKSRSPDFKQGLRDDTCRRLAWRGLFDSNCKKMELALRHAYALGCVVSGETTDERINNCKSTMEMKAWLDGHGYMPFSSFDLNA